MTHCATAPSEGPTTGRESAGLANRQPAICLITVSQFEETSNANDPTSVWRSGPS